MTDLEAVERILVPRACIDVAHSALAAAGRLGCEAFALWAGILVGNAFEVRETFIPRQDAYCMPDGVCVSVSGNELHSLNVWLYENEYRLIAQIHSHPTEAYHSVTDDTYPLVATVGAFSLVIPDFAQYPFTWIGTAGYRLSGQGEWTHVPEAELSRIFLIEG